MVVRWCNAVQSEKEDEDEDGRARHTFTTNFRAALPSFLRNYGVTLLAVIQQHRTRQGLTEKFATVSIVPLSVLFRYAHVLVLERYDLAPVPG